MSQQNINIKDILKILQLQKAEKTGDLEPLEQLAVSQLTPQLSTEQLLTNAILSPETMEVTRQVFVDNFDNGILESNRKGVYLNNAGHLETISENRIHVFADGTSTSPDGLTICQSCNNPVKEIHRCPCGRTVCQSPDCPSRFSESKQTWYCCNLHKLMHSIGIGLR